MVNLSAFPITVSEAGVFYRGTDKRWVIPKPVTSDAKPFPRRLESRSAVTLFSEKPLSIVNGKRMKCAYVKTDCGVIVKGNTPVFRQMANGEWRMANGEWRMANEI